ncbi:MAG: ABC transporter permease subunit [Bacteroidia bacterium]
MIKITKYVVYDILRNRILIGYTGLLLLVSLILFNLEDDNAKAILSITNIILFIVPLVSIIFTTIHFYNSYEFIELLVAQPLNRRTILLSEFFGVSISLVAAFAIGIGIPVLLYNHESTGIVMVFSGMLLTLIFVSLAFWSSVLTRDKARGMGLSLMLWFYFSLIYDGIVLFILFSLNDFPLDKPVIILTCLNPVDLSRILILLKMDISALMGFTGALFKDFLGTGTGMFASIGVMLLWIILPIFSAVRIFNRKNL